MKYDKININKIKKNTGSLKCNRNSQVNIYSYRANSQKKVSHDA